MGYTIYLYVFTVDLFGYHFNFLPYTKLSIKVVEEKVTFQAKSGARAGGSLALSFPLKALEDISECLRRKLIKDQFLIFISPKESKVNGFPIRSK